MPRVPDVIDPRSFPVAEISALRLDGELFPLARGLILADALDTPVVRAQAALAGCSRRLIAELGTAAWIWGALPAPPVRQELCSGMGERARLHAGSGSVREVVLRPEDVAVLGGVRVTTRLRTAVDLARLRPDDAYDAELLLRLLAPGEQAQALALLDARKRMPKRARARARIAALAWPPDRAEVRPEDQPPLTR